MFHVKHFQFAVRFIGVLAFGISGCTPGNTVTQPTPSPPAVDTGSPLLPNTPPLRIGIKFSQPGMGLMVGDQPQGFDIDVAHYIASHLGYQPSDIEWVEALAPAREILLNRGDVDLIVASYAQTPERAEAVDFAGPYFVAGQDVMVRSEDNTIHNVADLAGKRVCSNAGYTGFVRIQAMLHNNVEMSEGSRYIDCVQQLVDGAVDAVTTDDIILAGFAASPEYAGRVRLLGAPFSEELYSVGLPPNSPALCLEVSGIIQEMISDGSWERFLTQNTAGEDFTPNPTLNPPTKSLPCTRD